MGQCAVRVKGAAELSRGRGRVRDSDSDSDRDNDDDRDRDREVWGGTERFVAMGGREEYTTEPASAAYHVLIHVCLLSSFMFFSIPRMLHRAATVELEQDTQRRMLRVSVAGGKPLQWKDVAMERTHLSTLYSTAADETFLRMWKGGRGESDGGDKDEVEDQDQDKQPEEQDAHEEVRKAMNKALNKAREEAKAEELVRASAPPPSPPRLGADELCSVLCGHLGLDIDRARAIVINSPELVGRLSRANVEHVIELFLVRGPFPIYLTRSGTHK